MNKEIFQQYAAIHNQCSLIAEDLFLRLQKAEVIHDHNEERGGEDETTVFHPAKGYAFKGFKILKDGIKLNGEKYVGGGEYYNISIIIPIESLDNVEGYIQERQEALAEGERQRRVMRLAKEAKEKAEHQKWERETYERLKTQFEGAAQ